LSIGPDHISYTQDDDLAINLALRGKQSGYASLYRQHKDRVFATVSRVTRNSADTEDLVQVTFMKAFQALPRFRRQSAFSTWLTRIALNVSTTHLRSRKSQRECLDQVHRHAITDGNVKQETLAPDECVRRIERNELVEQSLETLPESYRQALRMHYLNQRSYHEITRELGIPLGTLKVWLFRARAKLRKEFEKSGLESHVL
jgi:RNA polymerase sigma factor (sigma-70 family)